ncbi:TIGR01906 family membrane protein [Companilactobacillus mishanensis]|uniref:TIGR01906 family membrane protein n=1 Tax=Companilactobacillus mishanensis TaxID=2486008 RepID=A0A5P0ZJN9_9LACO|nr:TIGR01906 family membrane protein [Companilactobacillus mishanensis]MQS52877.1 TIGR01906 family membrane protein [Companilactobacillus mishanensis]
MSNSQKDGIYTIGLALFFFTLAITATIFASYPIFHFDIGHYFLDQEANMSSSRLMHNYNQMMNYLINPFDWHWYLDDFRSSLSGRTHFEDCKKLFMLNFAVLIISGMYVWFNRKKRAYYNKVFLYIAIVGVILAALMVVDFDDFFVIFHKILFRNNDWLFDASLDPIIDVLPEEFFTQCFVLFFVLFEGLNIYKYFQKK